MTQSVYLCGGQASPEDLAAVQAFSDLLKRRPAARRRAALENRGTALAQQTSGVRPACKAEDGESKLDTVYRIIRDAHCGLSLGEIADRWPATPLQPRVKGSNLAPLVWWLWRRVGWIEPLPGTFPEYARYATTRLARTYPHV